MKRKRLATSMLSLLLTGFLIGMLPLSVDAVGFSDSTKVTNNGQLGAVDITLEESFPEEVTTILPGQTVDLSSSVINNGHPAWIRAKIEYPMTEGDALHQLPELGMTELDDNLITFANEDWTKIGSYYYLTEPVDTKEKVPFTTSVTYPTDWDNQLRDNSFGIVITAEAVQEANFTPDFTAEDPWHGVVIEAFDSDNYQPKEEGNEQFSIVYKNGSEGLVHAGDDFFANWGDLMPGDVLTGTAQISNQMKIPVSLYFAMESSGEKEILEQLHLTIKNGESVVYDGNLTGSIEPATLLMKYEPGSETEFSYELRVPAELNNAYALSQFQTAWTFSAEEHPPVEPEIIKTGQVIPIAIAILIGIALLSGIGYAVTRKKGGRKDED